MARYTKPHRIDTENLNRVCQELNDENRSFISADLSGSESPGRKSVILNLEMPQPFQVPRVRFTVRVKNYPGKGRDVENDEQTFDTLTEAVAAYNDLD